MRWRCRLFEREGTEREIEADDPDFAPDEYAKEIASGTAGVAEGDVTFVEVFDAGEWVLWRVEVLTPWPLLSLLTARTTAEDARREIKGGI